MCGHKTHRECGEWIETKASKQVERPPNIKKLEKKVSFHAKTGRTFATAVITNY